MRCFFMKNSNPLLNPNTNENNNINNDIDLNKGTNLIFKVNNIENNVNSNNINNVKNQRNKLKVKNLFIGDDSDVDDDLNPRSYVSNKSEDNTLNKEKEINNNRRHSFSEYTTKKVPGNNMRSKHRNNKKFNDNIGINSDFQVEHNNELNKELNKNNNMNFNFGKNNNKFNDSIKDNNNIINTSVNSIINNNNINNIFNNGDSNNQSMTDSFVQQPPITLTDVMLNAVNAMLKYGDENSNSIQDTIKDKEKHTIDYIDLFDKISNEQDIVQLQSKLEGIKKQKNENPKKPEMQTWALNWQIIGNNFIDFRSRLKNIDENSKNASNEEFSAIAHLFNNVSIIVGQKRVSFEATRYNKSNGESRIEVSIYFDEDKSKNSRSAQRTNEKFKITLNQNFELGITAKDSQEISIDKCGLDKQFLQQLLLKQGNLTKQHIIELERRKQYEEKMKLQRINEEKKKKEIQYFKQMQAEKEKQERILLEQQRQETMERLAAENENLRKQINNLCEKQKRFNNEKAISPQVMDKLFIDRAKKPANKIDLLDYLEILAPKKPENEVVYAEELLIKKQEKPENEIGYIDRLFLEEEERPQLELQQIEDYIIKSNGKKFNNETILPDTNNNNIYIPAEKKLKTSRRFDNHKLHDINNDIENTQTIIYQQQYSQRDNNDYKYKKTINNTNSEFYSGNYKIMNTQNRKDYNYISNNNNTKLNTKLNQNNNNSFEEDSNKDNHFSFEKNDNNKNDLFVNLFNNDGQRPSKMFHKNEEQSNIFINKNDNQLKYQEFFNTNINNKNKIEQKDNIINFNLFENTNQNNTNKDGGHNYDFGFQNDKSNKSNIMYNNDNNNIKINKISAGQRQNIAHKQQNINNSLNTEKLSMNMFSLGMSDESRLNNTNNRPLFNINNEDFNENDRKEQINNPDDNITEKLLVGHTMFSTTVKGTNKKKNVMTLLHDDEQGDNILNTYNNMNNGNRRTINSKMPNESERETSNDIFSDL